MKTQCFEQLLAGIEIQSCGGVCGREGSRGAGWFPPRPFVPSLLPIPFFRPLRLSFSPTPPPPGKPTRSTHPSFPIESNNVGFPLAYCVVLECACLQYKTSSHTTFAILELLNACSDSQLHMITLYYGIVFYSTRPQNYLSTLKCTFVSCGISEHTIVYYIAPHFITISFCILPYCIV